MLLFPIHDHYYLLLHQMRSYNYNRLSLTDINWNQLKSIKNKNKSTQSNKDQPGC